MSAGGTRIISHLELRQVLFGCLCHHTIQYFHFRCADDPVPEHALALVYPQTGNILRRGVGILIRLLLRTMVVNVMFRRSIPYNRE